MVAGFYRKCRSKDFDVIFWAIGWSPFVVTSLSWLQAVWLFLSIYLPCPQLREFGALFSFCGIRVRNESLSGRFGDLRFIWSISNHRLLFYIAEVYILGPQSHHSDKGWQIHSLGQICFTVCFYMAYIRECFSKLNFLDQKKNNNSSHVKIIESQIWCP